MKDIVETIDGKDGKIIEIHYDIDPLSPRENDNLDIMICFHKRYNLGDEHDYKQDDFNSWDELEAQIIKDHNPIVIKKLYLYDHSGITISTSPFSCPWDSGTVGFVLISKKAALENWSAKKVSKGLREKAEKYIEASVKEYDDFISGQVYGFIIKNKETDEELDSCWGFYGLDYIREQAEEACKHCKVQPKPQVEDPNQMKLALTE